MVTVAAATNTAVLVAFVMQALIPALPRPRPDAVVIMDNLAPHKAACVRKAFGQAGISYRYLPAYSPGMNPIEQAWSKLKTHLRPEPPAPATPWKPPFPTPSKPSPPATPKAGSAMQATR